jgi:hypothetical protein
MAGRSSAGCCRQFGGASFTACRRAACSDAVTGLRLAAGLASAGVVYWQPRVHCQLQLCAVHESCHASLSLGAVRDGCRAGHASFRGPAYELAVLLTTLTRCFDRQPVAGSPLTCNAPHMHACAAGLRAELQRCGARLRAWCKAAGEVKLAQLPVPSRWRLAPFVQLTRESKVASVRYASATQPGAARYRPAARARVAARRPDVAGAHAASARDGAPP